MPETRTKVGKPFFWTPQGICPAIPWVEPEGSWKKFGGFASPRGWYQWQSTGLVYLGESILDEETFGRMEMYAD